MRDNPNRKRNETHETLLARARRWAPPRVRWTEAIPQLSWHASFDGFRHTIMTSDKLLFLSFHIVLCDVLLILVVLALLGVSNLRRLSSVFFPTIVVFTLHVIPVADLVPNRSGKGFPANHILLLFLAIGLVVGSVSLFAPARNVSSSSTSSSSSYSSSTTTTKTISSLWCSKSSLLIGSWIFLSAVLLGAPIFELLAITSKYRAHARNGKWPAPPDCPFNATNGTVAVYDVAGNVLRYVPWPAPHGAAMYGGMHASMGDVGAYVLLVALVVVLFVGIIVCWKKGAGLEEQEAKLDAAVELGSRT